jgi:hypothetical protein
MRVLVLKRELTSEQWNFRVKITQLEIFLPYSEILIHFLVTAHDSSLTAFQKPN